MKSSTLDELSIRQRTCQQCGMLLDDAGQYHPYIFCVLRNAGRLDPWADFRWLALTSGLEDPGEKAPLVVEVRNRAGVRA